MEKVYKIQAAFVKNEASTALESREGYHVWRLIKEVPQASPMVLEVLEPRLAVQTVPGIAIAHWHVKAELENFTPTHNQYMVYGETGSATDVQARWNRAKEYLSSQLNSFHFNYRGPLDRVTQYEMKNVIYNVLAQVMGIEAYPFIENSLFEQQIASQELLCSYEPGSLFSLNLFTPHAARYKIVSAINYDFLKTMPVLDMNQLRLNKGIHRIRTAHHFWMLTVNYGGPDKIIEVIHGLPTKAAIDEITTNFSLSTRDAVLSIYPFSPKHNCKAVIPAHKTKTAYEGENAAEIWQYMKKIFIPVLNCEQVPYSFLGFGMTMLWGGKASNGNSAYASIGFIFETLIDNLSFFKIPRFEGFSAPGINNPILSREAIKDHFNKCSARPLDSVNKFF